MDQNTFKNIKNDLLNLDVGNIIKTPDDVDRIAFLREYNSKFFLLGSYEKIFLYNMDDCQLISTFRNQLNWVNVKDFESFKTGFFITVCYDAGLSIWDVTNASTCFKSIPLDSKHYHIETIEPFEKASIIVGSLTTGKITKFYSSSPGLFDLKEEFISDNTAKVTHIKHFKTRSPYNLLTHGAEDGKIYLFDLETSTCVNVYSGHTERVTSIVYYKDEVFFSSSYGGQIIQWSLNETNLINVYNLHITHINTMLLVPEESLIITSSEDKSIKISEINEKFEIKEIKCYPTPSAFVRIALVDDHPEVRMIATSWSEEKKEVYLYSLGTE